MAISNEEFSVGVVPMYPLSIVSGGFERQCIETTRALRRSGVDVEYLEWTSPDNRYDILHLYGPASHCHNILQYAHGRYKTVLSTIVNSRGRYKPYSYASRMFAWAGRYLRQSTIFEQNRQAFRWAERVICLNRLEESFISNVYGIQRSKLAIVSNGVANHFLSPDPEPFFSQFRLRGYVLFVGNIVERKNPLLLAETLLRMQVKGVFIGGIFASEQDYGKRFRELISSSPDLMWIENIDYDDPLLPSAYANASVYCLPSTAETQPLSAMEAMAAQLPIVLSDLPYAYQPPFERVLRHEPNNTSSLEKVLRIALCHSELYRQKLPDTFTWDEVARRIAHLYRQILTS